MSTSSADPTTGRSTPPSAAPSPGAAPGPGAPASRRSHPFARFVLIRLSVGLLLCLGITMLAFALTHAVPGDPVAANLGQRALGDPAAVAAFKEKNGLNDSLPSQYFTYLGNLLNGDLGTSQQTHRPVWDDLDQYVPASVELALVAIVLALALGVTMGVVAAVTRDRWPDQIIRVISLAGVSVPVFWLALVVFYVFFYQLGWFPAGGRLPPGAEPPGDITGLYTVDALLGGDFATFNDAASRLVLPASVLAAFNVGVLTRFTRAAVLEALGNDYVRAARAKGLPETTVIRRHVLRPALTSILTVAGLTFGGMLAGTVLVESVFSWPGLGQYAYRSALNLDLPSIMGVCLVVAVVYVVINLLVDLLYGVIDPRIRIS
ncbi:ABC transporter permease [Embleya sp. NBC_00896]|uniref:ABC transporter permease n=1 Tax=Embleya sp. NBC_00896 TaxID=2975961 RepID=UPI002F919C1C|nr:ABC transporter permease [Embleya sp. NBC_00896]